MLNLYIFTFRDGGTASVASDSIVSAVEFFEIHANREREKFVFDESIVKVEVVHEGVHVDSKAMRFHERVAGYDPS